MVTKCWTASWRMETYSIVWRQYWNRFCPHKMFALALDLLVVGSWNTWVNMLVNMGPVAKKEVQVHSASSKSELLTWRYKISPCLSIISCIVTRVMDFDCVWQDLLSQKQPRSTLRLTMMLLTCKEGKTFYFPLNNMKFYINWWIKNSHFKAGIHFATCHKIKL